MALPSVKLIPKKGQPDFIGFELNDDYAKLAHVHITKMKREVVDLISREVRGLSDDDISAFIKQTLTDLRIQAPRVYLIVPLQAVITRSIEIPSKDPDEIREIVNLQASRHTPYSRSEIIIDTLFIGAVRENYTKVLLVIVPRDIVVRQTRILEKAGFRAEKVLFPPEAIAHACTKILGNEHSDAATAIVHMDAVFTSFTVIQKGKLLFVRGIPVGADHLLEEKEVYADRFVDELQKSLESYTADEAGPMPSQLLLTGVVAEVTELDDLFSETLHIPIKHQTYFEYFSISDKAHAIAAASKHVSFFNLIAPILLYDRTKVDLVSEERKLRMDLERRAKEIMKTGVFVMVLLVMIFTFFVSKVFFRERYYQRLAQRYQPVIEDAKSLELVFAKTQLIKSYLTNRGNSIETLGELYDAIPPDVRLSNVKYDGGKTFTVKGTSRTMSAAFTFVSNLERADKFRNVKTKYVTTRSEDGVDVADFEIVALIGDEEAKAS